MQKRLMQFVAWLMVGMVCASVVAVQPVLKKNPPPVAAPPKKLIPWMEVNTPHSPVSKWFPDVQLSDPRMNMTDYCVEGLEQWSRVTNMAIVTTAPGQSQALYPQLMRRKPDHMLIIGGIKTYALPGVSRDDPRPYDFADEAGWQRIAEEAKRIVGITGTNVIVLENESSLKKYHEGEAKIDLDRFRRALLPLRESGLVFWWNLPQILPDRAEFRDRQAQTIKLIKLIAETLPESSFFTGFTMWHDWAGKGDGEPQRRQIMIDLVGLDRMHERLLVTTDGYIHYDDGRKKRAYTPEEAVRIIPTLPGKVINLYTSGRSWVETGKLFADAYLAPRATLDTKTLNPP